MSQVIISRKMVKKVAVAIKQLKQNPVKRAPHPNDNKTWSELFDLTPAK